MHTLGAVGHNHTSKQSHRHMPQVFFFERNYTTSISSVYEQGVNCTMSSVVLACSLVTCHLVYSRGLVNRGSSHVLLFGMFIVFYNIVFMDFDHYCIFFDRLLPFSKLPKYRCHIRFRQYRINFVFDTKM